MPNAHPGESDLSHRANNASTLAVTDGSGDELTLAVVFSCPKAVGAVKEIIATVVTTNKQPLVRSLFMIVASGERPAWRKPPGNNRRYQSQRESASHRPKLPPETQSSHPGSKNWPYLFSRRLSRSSWGQAVTHLQT